MSSSGKIARYCVMMLNSWTRVTSIVFVRCCWASSVGMATRSSRNQPVRIWRNFSFSSAGENACIRRK
uniref:Putative secreted protein n=1 Tax=Anopheles darlingi TaxID=43151 RepID=A0A2M4DJI7_ANODA